MAWIATTAAAGNVGVSGSIYYIRPRLVLPVPATEVRPIPIPPGVKVVAANPQFDVLNGDGYSRLYYTNGFTDNMVLTEHLKFMRQGMPAPTNPFKTGVGSGRYIGVDASTGLGVTGAALCAIRFVDELHGRRGPLSEFSPTINAVDKAFTWTNLLAAVPPPGIGATHLEGLRAMDGNSPRVAWRRQIGVDTVVEAVASLSLGAVQEESFTNFPRCRMNTFWNGRQALSGDDRYPDRLYFSNILEPEQYGGLYLRTRNGQPIVAIGNIRDTLIVLGPESSFIVNGYTEDDMTMDFLEPGVGGVSHQLFKKVHDVAFFLSHLSWYVCTGASLHPIGDAFDETWKEEYARNETLYNTEAWMVNDKESRVLKVWGGSIRAVERSVDSGIHDTEGFGSNNYWCLDYSRTLRQEGGAFGEPLLSYDGRNRRDYSGAILSLPGSRRGYLFTGSDDGYIRRENADDDTTDDGDSAGLRSGLVTKHYMPTGPGGDDLDGSSFTAFWIMGKLAGATAKLYGGDVNAAEAQNNGGYMLPLPSAEVDEFDDEPTVAPSGNISVPKDNYFFEPDFAGRGFTLRLTNFEEFAGFGYRRSPGPNDRGEVPPAGGG